MTNDNSSQESDEYTIRDLIEDVYHEHKETTEALRREMSDDTASVHPETLRIEEMVLSRLIVDGHAGIDEAINAGLIRESFTYQSHGHIFDALLKLYEDKSPIDLVTITDELIKTGTLSKSGGSFKLSKLEYYADMPSGVSFHAKMLAENGLRKKALGVARGIENDILSGTSIQESIDRAQGSLHAINRSAISNTVDLRIVARELNKELPILGGKPQRISCGLEAIDKILGGGLTPGEMVVLAARPSMGKTALALTMVHRLSVVKKVPTAFFSLEMGAKSLVGRVVALDSGCALNKEGTHSEASRVCASLAEIEKSPILIDETSSLPIFDLKSRARRLVEKNGVQIIFVDYLQLMRGEPNTEKRIEEVGQISRGLKSIARELKVPVVALSQLNRAVEGRAEKRPQLADLRESGDIEQDADVVGLLYREGYYRRDSDAINDDSSERAEVIIAKNRNGPTGIAELAYRASLPGFADLSRREEWYQYD